MKLSTRTRYGIRALLELAENSAEGPVQIRTIAQRQDISIKYLEQLMTILKSAGFVRSVRGSKGGYLLAKAAKQIRLSDVFRALEGPSAINLECLENKSYCVRAADCAVRDVWSQLQEAIVTVLESITMQDLVDKAAKKRMLYYQI